MKKTLRLFLAFAMVAGMISGLPAQAAVSVSMGPASLVTSPIYLKGSSAPLPLFEVALSATAGETLSGMTVLVNQTGTSTVNSSDFSNLSLYKDDGNNVFSSSSDTVLASPAAVNVGTTTALSLSSTSTPATGKFFVVLTTSSSWGDANPAERITVTLPANAITTSAGTVTSAAATTAAIIGDSARPRLVSATAKNTGGTQAKEAGDSVELVFSEPTNKAAVTASNINTLFTLGGGHSFLNASGTLGGAIWDESGTKLTITLASSTSTTTLPTVVSGDSIAVTGNSALTDLAGNLAQGSVNITGSFGGQVAEDEDEENVAGTCNNGIINGRLYKIGSEPTVYLAAACRLKPFRGSAVFKARGQKFQNIITLQAKPDNVTISEKPVLPAAGTLVKGSDRTVWFVSKNGERRGFVSGEHFLSLGFKFDKVMVISDGDLSIIPTAAPIENNEDHPDGALIKCANSAAVYQVIGKVKFPFASSQTFSGKGHTFEHVLVVNCSQYSYPTGTQISQ